MKTYCFDLDGTICSLVENSNYINAIPDVCVVQEINRLYNNGNKIIIMSARGCVSGIDHSEFTYNQLNTWGVKYNSLLMNVKPHADYFIDDRAININDWKKTIPVIKGIVAGAFDLIHPGYCKMFIECKLLCNHLTVALHENPALENGKLTPILSVEERLNVLKCIKYIDDVIIYKTEKDLYTILKSNPYNIRFLGDDYKNKDYTGKDLNIKIHFIDRSHGYSTTKIKNKIKELS
jgi:glycerol-3-phosphate cytidylyltransferase